MTDKSKWEALKVWLETERDKAGEASRDAADAVTAAAAGASDREFDAAIGVANTVNGRCAALREAAGKMAELERGESRPRLRDDREERL